MPLNSGAENVTSLVAANSNNATVLKAEPGGVLYTLACYSILATPVFLKFYNKATAPAPGTDNGLLVARFMVPGVAGNTGGGFNLSFPNGWGGTGLFNAGLSFALVTGIGDTDNTSPAAASVLLNIGWN